MSNRTLWDGFVKYRDTLTQTKKKDLSDDLVSHFFYQDKGKASKQLKRARPVEGDTLESFRRYYNWVRLLHFNLGIPLSYFDIDDNRIFNRHGYTFNAFRRTIDLKPEWKNEKGAQDFVEEYCSNLSPLVLETNHELYVYEYLHKGGSDFDSKYLKSYSDAHDKIFKSIEKSISDNFGKLTYRRYLAFPIMSGLGNVKNKAALLQEALKTCTPSLFMHMVRSFDKFHNWWDSETNSSGFIMVPQPTRSYNYGLLSQKKNGEEKTTMVTEYFRYTKSGNYIPNLLYIDSIIPGISDTAYSVYHGEMKELYREGMRIHLTTESFISFLEETIEETKNELDSIDSLRDNIKHGHVKNHLKSLRFKLNLYHKYSSKTLKT